MRRGRALFAAGLVSSWTTLVACAPFQEAGGGPSPADAGAPEADSTTVDAGSVAADAGKPPSARASCKDGGTDVVLCADFDDGTFMPFAASELQKTQGSTIDVDGGDLVIDVPGHDAVTERFKHRLFAKAADVPARVRMEAWATVEPHEATAETAYFSIFGLFAGGFSIEAYLSTAGEVSFYYQSGAVPDDGHPYTVGQVPFGARQHFVLDLDAQGTIELTVTDDDGAPIASQLYPSGSIGDGKPAPLDLGQSVSGYVTLGVYHEGQAAGQGDLPQLRVTYDYFAVVKEAAR